MPTLQPQISELLRTLAHPPSLLLRITKVERVDVKCQLGPDIQSPKTAAPTFEEEPRRYAVRLLLTDGHLVIQALLHRKLVNAAETSDLEEDDLIEIRKFQLKGSARQAGRGRILYLGVEDALFFKRSPFIRSDQSKDHLVESSTVRKRKRGDSHNGQSILPPPPGSLNPATPGQRKKSKYVNFSDLSAIPSYQAPKSESENPPDEDDTSSTPTKATHKQSTSRSKPTVVLDESRSEDESFETVIPNHKAVRERRCALAVLDGNTSFGSQTNLGLPDSISTQDKKSSVISCTDLFSDPTVSSPDPSFAKPGEYAPRFLNVEGAFRLSSSQLAAHQPRSRHRSAHQQMLPCPELSKDRSVAQTQPDPLPQPVALSPPSFHTLASLRRPPEHAPLPEKSYTLTTLAFITWSGGSLLSKVGSAFPPKRHIKITDPSLVDAQKRRQEGEVNPADLFKPSNQFQDAITVAVYIDAKCFKPILGSIVLLRGVVMQKLVNGDVILNAYGRLRDTRFEEPTFILNDSTKPVSADKASTQRHRFSQDESQWLEDNKHWYITDHDRIRQLGYGSKLDYYLEWSQDRKVVTTSG